MCCTQKVAAVSSCEGSLGRKQLWVAAHHGGWKQAPGFQGRDVEKLKDRDDICDWCGLKGRIMLTTHCSTVHGSNGGAGDQSKDHAFLCVVQVAASWTLKMKYCPLA